MAGLVRQDLNPRSSLYKQIANAVNRGELVPEEIIFGLLSKRLEDGYCRGESGFILDGLPRSRIQAEILSELVEIDLVVNFKCTERCLVEHEREGAWREKLRIFAEQSKLLEDYYKKRDKLLDFQVSSAPGETWKGCWLRYIYTPPCCRISA
ncbi:adenylate kinase 7 [Pyrus ussuriensis x Pyrus communis]|uniref:adenylate kinase n=1 Tax=Pyrus ussuriensis x Pyrus communis TaxID=2448454 RepID=A0A5N5HZ23_9ROSA|nr:adenylate kinase 7 [Pyrus ussuriensis x Pyrus communis]